ncbi:acyl-CoA dehydrogenase C-terminal domain-containing protein [Cocleimonas sp. KMM 6892]|jgi:alkylation response protein AidB-like acyl-CoA dehydrogenase|uniref:acyl-CoA dehydrogenase C-terminal domain-containing protein n=1 Tax=unclassified Cocleimonas TaxID=2639732 RepID=UPI002DBE3FEF|nr:MULTISPECIES: acyl-CoA dehydrogenase C-terminal domain-containing protein [unclassified Cocleimonas]MEB8434357.1 acyl-CoA dehydrogenase C-terminal domain-containing protein [Cocleimonas sp. KMM 6892]MEC4717240.1 acyl-CoA dehydrogenase C-terminal domain-containing protein [Cocleimonas sp. KMM 6895]MEC4746619.1 acyl-CoA dehydrogenase C-terminal domain-containing protein [Cocleimonas sp. KMM 6896]
MSYEAPLKEMQFVLKELADINAIAQHPGFEDATPDMVEAILKEAGKLASLVIEPLNNIGDQQGSRLENGVVVNPDGFKEAYQQFVENGWPGLHQPTEFDGQGLPFLMQSAVSEMWNASNMAFALCPMLTAGAIEAINAHGSDEIKKTYLPKMVSGEWTGTMNLTEPQAGSDLSAVRTQATKEGDHYLIKGSKIFITWGDHEMTDNIAHLVLARLPDAPEGVKGISLFIVPKYLINEDGSLGERNDAKAVSLEHKLGIHASPTCVMSFGDETGAVGYLIGEENNGLSCMFTMMNHARLEVGMEGVGLSEGAYQHALAYAKDRTQGYSPGSEGRVSIIHHADVRRMLMQMKAFTEAGRALAYVAAGAHDHAYQSTDEKVADFQRRRMDLLTPIVKAWCTEVAQEVTSLGVQVHGGMGFIEETGAAQYMRDARIITIYEGTTGIQAGDLIGRKVLRDKGATVSELIAELNEFETTLKAQSGDDFAIMSTQFSAALKAVTESTKWVLEKGMETPHSAGAASVNYLMLMGTALGGWLMAKSALAAQREIDAGSTDEFFKTKILTARFYAEHILPRSEAYATTVQSGAGAIMDLSIENF